MSFRRTFLRLLIPSVIQNMVASSLFVVDNIMIGKLGQNELAAVAQANQLSFVINIFMFGVVSGAAIFASQYWGKKDPKGISHVLGISLLAGGCIGVIGLLAATIFPYQFMHLYSKDPAVIDLGMEYLSIIRFAYLFMAINSVYSAVNKSTECVKLPMIAGICALSTNTILNYCLIFGNFGFPKLALRGGALASVIATVIECSVMLSFTYIKKYPAAAKIKDMFSFDQSFVVRYFKTSLPVLLNEGLWGLGTTVFSMVYGTMSTLSLAAVSISGTLERFLYVIVIGVVHASNIMVGKYIGAGDLDGAYQTGKRALRWGVLIGAVCAVVVILMRQPMISLFKVPDSTKEVAMILVLVVAIATPLRAFNFVNVVGVLRAGGDTFFSLCMDTGSIWLISVPLVYITGVVLQWPIQLVMPFIFFEDIVKLFIGLARFRSKRWIRNLVGTAHVK